MEHEPTVMNEHCGGSIGRCRENAREEDTLPFEGSQENQQEKACEDEIYIYRKKLHRLKGRDCESANYIILKIRYTRQRNKCVNMLKRAKSEHIRSRVVNEVQANRNP